MADIFFVDSEDYLAEDNSPSIIGTASFIVGLCTVFVALRYYARHLAQTAWRVEDVIIPFAWIAQMGTCIVAIWMVDNGTGRHITYLLEVDPRAVGRHNRGMIIQELLYPAAVALSKLTVVLLYLQIFTNRVERFIAKSLFVLISATWISFTIAAVYQCVPFEFNWNKAIPEGKCFNVWLYAVVSSIPNIVGGVIVLVLPLRMVLSLKISTARKLALLLIFLTGTIGIAASIIRTVVFSRTLEQFGPLPDVTYNYTPLINWTMIEPGMYLVSACAISFKPILRQLAKILFIHNLITRDQAAFSNSSPLGKPDAPNTLFDLNTVELAAARNFYSLRGESMDAGSRDKKHNTLPPVPESTSEGRRGSEESDREDDKEIESGHFGLIVIKKSDDMV